MKTEKYIPEIDGLRAIAVISVVLFHAGFPLFNGGYVGVDIFFVLSGYLITRLIITEASESGNFNYSRFYYRRAKRLFPALYLVLLLTFLLAFLLFTPQHFERFGGELIYSIVSLSNFYFWNESGYFNTAADFKPLLHTWSLSVEEQFYLIWPTLILFLLKTRRLAIFRASLLALATISLIANVIMADGHSDLLSEFSPAISSLFSRPCRIHPITPANPKFCWPEPNRE